MQMTRDCSNVQWIRPSVSTVMLNPERVLLLQRADSGQWSLPSGSVETGRP